MKPFFKFSLFFAIVFLLGCEPSIEDDPPTNTKTTWTKENEGTTKAPDSSDESEAPRLKFAAGQELLSSSEFLLEGRAALKDWGVQGAVSFAVAGMTVSGVTILEADDDSLVANVIIGEARLTEMRLSDPEIRIELGDSIHGAFDFLAGMLAMASEEYAVIAPGDSAFFEASANQAIRTFLSMKPMTEMATALVEGMINIDWFEGARFRVHFDAFEGTTRIEILPDSPAQNFDALAETASGLESLVPYLDSIFLFNNAILPPESDTPGASWTIQARDLPIRSPSILPWRSEGSLRTTRLPENGEAGEIRLAIEPGENPVTLLMRPINNEIAVQVRPTGTVEIDTTDHLVTAAELSGNLSITQRSTDHWLFEARHEVAPMFYFRYSCELR